MIPIFCGYEERESVGLHVFISSVIRRTDAPVMFCPIHDKEHTDGSNAFTYARFLVPEMCGFHGWAIFADASDMLMLGDIAELWAMRDDRYAVQVVKHSYRTRHPIKYIGTSMQCPNVDYPRKQWSSVMLINCSAPEWKDAATSGKPAHQFAGFADERIGALPPEWNCIVDEGQDATGAKLLHYTAGLPCFPAYKDTPTADKWREERALMESADV